jgi:phage repressor protein C with HTH and peptisase S24 domain
MFTHAEIWRAIDRLAEKSGYSASGLAKSAGLDPTTFNKSKRTSADGKPRWPSTESVAKILAVTRTDMHTFIAAAKYREQAPPVTTLPVIGYAQAGRAGYFDDAGYPAGEGWDQISFPGGGGKDDVPSYALKISGNSMEPLYRAGDMLVVAPGAKIRKGDRVIVKTREGEVMVKELMRQGADRVELRSLNASHKNIALRGEEIAWIARVMWVSQ